MTDEDLKLIRQIIADFGRKYTAGNSDRRKYDRLVDLGWLTSSATNISDVEYNATERAERRRVQNDGDADPPPVEIGLKAKIGAAGHWTIS
jgi:hypothetical protein